VQSAALARRDLLAYSGFALPLAMAALPVYVHVPKFYGDSLGLPLATVGAILLACRLLDALQDPFLGWLSDRTAGGKWGRATLIVAALPFLAIGFVALFNPPLDRGGGLWLSASLIVVYLGFSMGSIAYYALGAELSADYHERTRVTATRGAAAVAGVLVAAALPEWLAARLGARSGLALFSLLFVAVLAVCARLCIAAAPRRAYAPSVAPHRARRRALIEPLADRRYRWLIAVSMLSGVAAAIPGTLVLFYVQDVLRRPDLSGLFLALYFLFAALGMPLWIDSARRVGKKRTWLIGMLLSVAAFVWAFLLGAGDALAFAGVCVLSGLAYGAELAIPPSMLADVVDRHAGAAAGGRPDGAYFGVWQMVEKLNLALAAGLALPLLQWLGYVPGAAQAPQAPLSWIYALVPCAIKLAAAACLWAAPLETRRPAPVASRRDAAADTPRPGVTPS
jgi:Na+/melibiose symporter-like transporter